MRGLSLIGLGLILIVLVLAILDVSLVIRALLLIPAWYLIGFDAGYSRRTDTD